jgi:glyoxylase-like metal-dependent hydrolase (beta-lactamase superfamily II)
MLMLDRRMLLRSGSAAVGAAALAPAALAHAPQLGKAQPGFYRFKLGAIEITVVSDGTLAFPAETLWGDRAEDARSLLTSTFQPSSPVGLTQTNLKLASPRLRQIKAGAEVASGVTTFDTAGHTPGHMSVHISSGREEMLLTGDVVVDTEIGFLHPEWAFGFDLDVQLATKARMAFLDRAAADKTLVGSYHLPFPGFGHVVREGSGYRWLPADWQWTS